MLKNIILLLTVAVFLSGCATSRTKKADQMQDLQSRITALETQQQQQDVEITDLKRSVGTGTADVSTSTSSVGYAVKSNKNIQRALKNAGYYGGPIDGIIGSKTKKAISDFQRDNGLKVDGIVGKQTWSVLSTRL